MLPQGTILLAEDKDDEAFLLERALKKASISNPVQRVKNGDEAVDYLIGMGCYADRSKYPLPILLLLDLNMPKRSGFEVLEWMRSQSALQTLAVDVLSGSSRPEDVEKALKLGANLYLKKPITVESLNELLQGYRQILICRGFAKA